MTLYDDLTRRGLIAQMSHPDETEKLLNGTPIKFYIGYDATADSLHVGHLVQLIIMRRLQDAGHIPVCLLGTGTTVIGDPSGKSDMRKMLETDTIAENARLFREQMSHFLDFSEGKALVLENGDWLKNLNYLEFIREIGVYFSVNRMLAAECYKMRLEKGLSFLELNYMLLQSYDFLYLFRHHGVKLEVGGDDQWSNILAGADLIRRCEKEDAFALTIKLLLTSEGKKMGKTEKGAVWLDKNKTTPYEMYQYFRNVNDADVIQCLKMLTFVPIDEIERMERTLSGNQLNQVKELLAYEVVKFVHGKDEADKSLESARSLFEAGGSDAPAVSVGEAELGILELLVRTGLCPSKRDARTNVEQGGVTIDGEKVTDANAVVSVGSGVLVKKGKKSFVKAVR
ncbi:MAG: tyrosine--tRNA ligase [Oscillospiraceae bacterium]|jgi:tyrosyl-tRNA synthetase|nr:tyrosine--tRNA ligase [Oscillospiraceae bacterium]